MGPARPNPIARAWLTALAERRGAWWSYALHLTSNEPDAEDLVQTMLTTMLERGIAPDDVAHAYPFRVMRNVHLTRARREHTQRAHAPRLVRTSDDPPDTPDLARALDALTDEQREVITLKHACGLTLEQISRVTDTPLGTVAGRHRRALEALRARLASIEEIRP
ncbi:MAG: sigma-70 family RNA polymerase sigma factor [Phycisphaerales bacterium]